MGGGGHYAPPCEAWRMWLGSPVCMLLFSVGGSQYCPVCQLVQMGGGKQKLGPWVKEEGITDQSRLVFTLIGVDGSLAPGHLLSWVDWTAALPQGVC